MAVGPLSEFIIAMMKLREGYQTIKPLSIQLDNIELKLKNKQNTLEDFEESIKEIEERIKELKEEFQVKTGQSELLRKELEQIKKIQKVSIELLKGL